MGRLLGKFLGSSFVNETPSGAINGTNVTFTLASQPAGASALILMLDGEVQRGQGTEYTLSGATNQTITMVKAPALGQFIYAYYVKNK